MFLWQNIPSVAIKLIIYKTHVPSSSADLFIIPLECPPSALSISAPRIEIITNNSEACVIPASVNTFYKTF